VRYGIHTEHVEEVLRFAQAGALLVPGTARPIHVTQIDDLAQAKLLAWQEVYGPEELLWSDIRQREMSNIKREAYNSETFTEVRTTLSSLLEELPSVVRRGLSGDHAELLDDVVADLFNCAFSRAFHGPGDGFFERLFAVYRAGGWPCGWDGDYPLGRVVAYYRSA